MNEGLPATLQPRRSSASFLDPVPRSMPLSLSITRSPLFLLSLPVLSFSRFLSRQSCPDSRFFSPGLQQLQEPAKRDTTRRRRCCRCDDATVGETRPKKAPVQCMQLPPPSSAQKRRGSMPTIYSSPLFKSADAAFFNSIKFIGNLGDQS